MLDEVIGIKVKKDNKCRGEKPDLKMKDELDYLMFYMDKEDFIKLWNFYKPKNIEFKEPIIYGTSGE